jgi:ABC-type Fe3+/spermidine/putrescine transport system ATPase subunit
MIHKANNDILHNILETRSNEAKLLSSDQIVQMQNDKSVQSQNLQELYYQNKRNELLQKGYKTAMAITHVRTANGALEKDIFTQTNGITALNNHLETQLQALQ